MDNFDITIFIIEGVWIIGYTIWLYYKYKKELKAFNKRLEKML